MHFLQLFGVFFSGPVHYFIVFFYSLENPIFQLSSIPVDILEEVYYEYAAGNLMA